MSDEKKHVIKAFHHKTTRYGLGHVQVQWVYPRVWKCLIWDKDERWAFVDISDLSFDTADDVNAFDVMLERAIRHSKSVEVEEMPELRGAFNTYPQC